MKFYNFYTFRLGLASISTLSIPLIAQSQPQQKQQWIYMFGKKECIPLPQQSDFHQPTYVPWFTESGFKWSSINFGTFFGVAVSKCGKLFIWGDPHDDLPETEGHSEVIQPFLYPSKGFIKDAQCSSNKVFILDSNGNVSIIKDISKVLIKHKDNISQDVSDSLQDPSNKKPSQDNTNAEVIVTDTLPGLPQPGWFSNNKVIKMSVGPNHAAFITMKGEIYCYGSNEYGQCGVDPYSPDVNTYEGCVKVKFPEGVRLVNASCGKCHTVVMDSEGNIYTLGDDSKIQLFLGDTRSVARVEPDRSVFEMTKKDKPIGNNRAKVSYKPHERHFQYTPQQVLPPPSYHRTMEWSKPIDFVTGDDFTIIKYTEKVDGNNQRSFLFCSGENQFGQCGRTLNKHQQNIASVKIPTNEDSLITSCGSNHCLTYTRNHNLYGWGYNMHGQLGQRSMIICPPIKLNKLAKSQIGTDIVPDKETMDKAISHISCSFANSVIIYEQN